MAAIVCLTSGGCMTLLWQSGKLAENMGVKHEVDGFADVSVDRVGLAVQSVLEEEGSIQSGHSASGKISAVVEGAEVRASWKAISDDCVRVRVRVDAEKEGRMDAEEISERLYQRILAKCR